MIVYKYSYNYWRCEYTYNTAEKKKHIEEKLQNEKRLYKGLKTSIWKKINIKLIANKKWKKKRF